MIIVWKAYEKIGSYGGFSLFRECDLFAVFYISLELCIVALDECPCWKECFERETCLRSALFESVTHLKCQ